MRVSAKQVAQAVKEVESGADDPKHVAAVVGAFMQRQPLIGHYVSAHTSDLTLEGMVLTLLHASVLARAVELTAGRRLRPLAAKELDVAASSPGSGERALATEEPELVGYLLSNIVAADPTLGGKRRPKALGLLRVIARALVDHIS